MHLRYRYRCEPSPGQKIALAQAFGCTCVVWNDALALSQELCSQGEKYPGGGALQKLCIIQARRAPARQWPGGVSASMLQQSVLDLDQAFRNWWNRNGKVCAPRFKKGSNARSIRIYGREFRTTAHGVRSPTLAELKLRRSRDLPAPPSSVTIIRDTRGWYYASFVVEVEEEPLPANTKTIGVDPGLASLAVTSDGEKIAPPRFLRSVLKRRRRVQRNLKSKVKGSHRLVKARRRVARLHSQIADRRLDFLHKLGTPLIRENQAVVVEDLNVSGLNKNRKLARSIADAGWRLLRGLLEYKATLYGRAVRVISPWEPTSQRCSACGDRGCKKELAVRSWTCPTCGTEHDRDVNAAKNILAAGLTERLSGRGAESRTGLPASGKEAATRLDREVCHAS